MADRNNTTMPAHRTYSLMHEHLAERLEALIHMQSLIANDPSINDTAAIQQGMAELVQYTRGYTRAMMHAGHIEPDLAASYNRSYNYYCADPADAEASKNDFSEFDQEKNGVRAPNLTVSQS